jgi:tRNA G37 N-methylase Trm5
MVVDCYVMQMGEEETQKFLKHAVESVKSGNHSHLYENLPKNLIN